MKEKVSLHEERIATTDEFGHRVYVHPEDVHGPWRNRRTWVYSVLVIIYLALPWIHFGGKQIILLNLADREFTFFGSTFYAHDGPLVFFLLVGFVLAFGLITAIWGRLWCGWACPQTVFIDLVYRRIETMIEGKAKERKKLQQAPMSFSKLIKKSTKWFLFLIVSMHLAHTGLGYFLGARELFWITLSPPSEHMTSFVAMWVVTLIILFDFGWFREQFCLIACPYGRFQSVMMDTFSKVVAYDFNRGEPRRGEVPKEQEGDCINCFACVKVCPTAIDIRRGTQLECIACTQCIDACDDIMQKVGKPKGLIRYTSEAELEGKKPQLMKARTWVYLFLFTVVATTFTFALQKRQELSLQLIRGNKTAFQTITRDNGEVEIVNHYHASFYYQGDKNLHLYFDTTPVFDSEDLRVVTPIKPLKVKSGKHTKGNLFFRFRPSLLKEGSLKIKLNVWEGESRQKAKLLRVEEVLLVGPFNQ